MKFEIIPCRQALRNIHITIDYYSGVTLKKVSEIYGPSRERCRQIHGKYVRRILRQMNVYVSGDELKINRSKENLGYLLLYKDFLTQYLGGNDAFM